MVGKPPRPDGSAYIRFHYARMDLVGTPSSADLVGYSLGNQPPNPPKLCTKADLGNLPYGKLIGDGSQAAVFEFFNKGFSTSTTTSPNFDLRFEGANRSITTPKGSKYRETLVLTGANCNNKGAFTCPK